MKLPRFLRPPPAFSHEQALRRLASLGFAPTVIYDVGAFYGYWTKATRKVFPQAQYLLFEANADNAAKLSEGGERFFIATLSADERSERTFYLPKHAVGTGASLYREQSEHYAGDNLRAVKVTTRRLDALVAEHDLPPPHLIKLDVQGAELDVLAGAGELLEHAGALIAELSLLAHNEAAPLIAEVIEGIDRLGFRCADVCDVLKGPHGGVMQMDMLFVKPALFEKFRAAAGLRA
jgi:FkbM family methyltransferase